MHTVTSYFTRSTKMFCFLKSLKQLLKKVFQFCRCYFRTFKIIHIFTLYEDFKNLEESHSASMGSTQPVLSSKLIFFTRPYCVPNLAANRQYSQSRDRWRNVTPRIMRHTWSHVSVLCLLFSSYSKDFFVSSQTKFLDTRIYGMYVYN